MQSGSEETVQELRKQVSEEIASLENKAEREKESIDSNNYLINFSIYCDLTWLYEMKGCKA